VLWQTGSTANAYRFTGERYDADLELYYLRARWYNQGTGRFLTRDTYPLNAHHPSEWNRYGYVANNPVNAVDPSGLLMVSNALTYNNVSVPAIPGLVETSIIVLASAIAIYVILCASTLADNVLCAQHGTNNLRNHVVAQVQEQIQRNGGDPCAILEAMLQLTTDSKSRAAIRVAQKYFKCRRSRHSH
jgi:RHS repeat-associated protein